MVVSPTLELHEPSTLRELWLVLDYGTRKTHVLTSHHAAVLVALMGDDLSRDELADRLACSDHERDLLEAVVADLEKNQLISASAGDIASRRGVSMIREWSENNWAAASRYQTLTLDYPGLDYTPSGGGYAQDLAYMLEYSTEEPDHDRVLTCTELIAALPDPHLAAEDISHADDPDTEHLMPQVLSVVFGATGKKILTRRAATPLLRRTSPSGGGRHPSEAYVLNVDCPELPSGCCHIRVDPPGLDRDERVEALGRVLQSMSTDGDVLLLVLTSRVARNMYRYREPRTYRTIHMDAGHLIGSFGMLANTIGYNIAVECPNPKGVEDVLGDPLMEPAVALVRVTKAQES